jgi:hypothetical protein
MKKPDGLLKCAEQQRAGISFFGVLLMSFPWLIRLRALAAGS